MNSLSKQHGRNFIAFKLFQCHTPESCGCWRAKPPCATMFPRATALGFSTPPSSHSVRYSGQRPEDVRALRQHNGGNSTAERNN